MFEPCTTIDTLVRRSNSGVNYSVFELCQIVRSLRWRMNLGREIFKYIATRYLSFNGKNFKYLPETLTISPILSTISKVFRALCRNEFRK